MVCREGNQVIHAFPPQRADEPLAEGIRLRALGRGFEDPEPQVTNVLVEVLRENAIPVMEEETVAMVRRERFAQLPSFRAKKGCFQG